MPQISSRTSDLGTENAFVVLKEVNDLIAQGREIISFCIGQPDFNTPPNICEAAIKAIRDGRHGYTPSAGIPELREALVFLFMPLRPLHTEQFRSRFIFLKARVSVLTLTNWNP